MGMRIHCALFRTYSFSLRVIDFMMIASQSPGYNLQTKGSLKAGVQASLTSTPTPMPSNTGLTTEPSRIGLCANCQHMRQITSDRGSTFYLCQRSATDLKFPKYPRLPVIECSGYEPEPEGGDSETNSIRTP